MGGPAHQERILGLVRFVACFPMKSSPIQRTFVAATLERAWNVARSSNVVKRMTAMYKGRGALFLTWFRMCTPFPYRVLH